MPNDIKNILEFDCGPEQSREIMEFLKDEKQGLGSLDFNKLIPMPEKLNIEAGSSTTKGIEIYLTVVNPDTKDFGYPKLTKADFGELLQKLNRERLFARYNGNLSDGEIAESAKWESIDFFCQLGKTACENMRQYGATTWYEWCNKNWGTKWNAYDCESVDPAGGRMEFQTAWSSVPELIQKISERFPNVLIHYAWADEDIGFNTGSIDFKGGEQVDWDIPEGGSRQAYEMACEIQGLDMEELAIELEIEDFGNPVKNKDRDER